MNIESLANRSQVGWVTIIESLGLPWIKILNNLYSFWGLLQTLFHKGLYEVVEYVTILELKDKNGNNAHLNKYEKIRYLQNNIIAFQDQAWGDGKILINYRCKPGVPVDIYRSGFKNYILISLRNVKTRGDIDEFHIDWGIRRGFLRPTGFWATEINHYTKKIKVQIIFPKARPPLTATVLEKNRQRTIPLEKKSISQLSNGKWEITWTLDHPKLFEQYILKWEW